MRKIVAAVVLLAALGGGGYWYYTYSKKISPPTVTTSVVTRGDIVESVGATGTLQAVTTVQVGSQVSGNIAFLGADFNSLVRKGQVLARLDPSLFEAQAQQSRANLAQARANLVKAQSDLERNRVLLLDAQQRFARAKELSNRGLLPQSDLDTAKTTVDTAEATVQSQQATVTQVQAAIMQSEAAVNQTQVNLDHTVITSPIDGLVISRNVDVGQTVAASMQAPTLFVLAADLTKMQVVANLDESDVGRIRPRQAVTFRVDAYPQDQFLGTVSQVRLEPKVQQNVVTYATVIDVPNNDLRLKPGMTANVTVEISRATNVLRLPNTALRFRPSTEVFAALGQTPPEPPARGGGPGGGRRGAGANGEGATDTSTAPPPTAATPLAPGSPPRAPVAGRAAESNTAPDAAGRPARTATAGADDARGADTVRVAPQGASGSNAGGGQGGNSAAGPAGSLADGDQSGDRRSRFADRLQNMTPEERDAALARMRARGFDPTSPDAAGRGFSGGRGAARGPFGATGGGSGQGGRSADAGQPATARRAGPAATTGVQAGSDATTIDAMFAPLARSITRGMAWVFANNQLQRVPLRLGITDGQNTELVDGDVSEGAAVVTNVVIAGQTTRPTTTTFPGFGQPGRGAGFPGGGGGGRGNGS